MKTISILLILFSLTGLGLAQTQTKYIIQVNGLTCPFCAYGLEKKLKKVKGVESVSIDLEKDEAVVLTRAGETVEEESLRKAVRSAGFSIASLKKSGVGTRDPPVGDGACKSRRGPEMIWIKAAATLLWVAVLSNTPILGQVLPFFTNTSLTVGFQSNALRTFSRFVARNRLEIDGTEVADREDREVFVFAQVLAVPVRLGPGTVLTVAAPILRKETNFTAPGAARTGFAASGLGDVTLTLKQRFYHNDFLGGGLQAALIGGLKLPTGSSHQRDAQGSPLSRGLQPGTGSVDVPLGLVFTAFRDRVGFNADLLYQFNNRSDGFRFGDETKIDLALGYRLFPTKYKSIRDKSLSAYLELNTALSQRADFNQLEISDSGGTIVFLTPGIQAVLNPRFLVEAAFQVPVFQRLNGTQLAFAPTANFGIRLLF